MAPEERVGTERLLQTFERRFLASRALRSFPWQSLEEELRGPSGLKLLQDLVQRTARHPLCVKHPPSGTYVRRFLSELIRKHEAVHAEPLDELYEALAEVLATEESTQCRRSYLLPSGDAVTLTESTAIVAHGTTGLVTWDAALYLAEWAVQNPAAFAHRTVLELGSGAGLTGLAICRTCHPRAFVFSDCHSRVLEQLRQNIALNGFSLEPDVTADPRQPAVTVAQLDWDVATDLQLSAFQPDVVIAADVLYCPDAILSLVGLLRRLSGCRKEKRAPDVYVASTVRNPGTPQLFTAQLGSCLLRSGDIHPSAGALIRCHGMPEMQRPLAGVLALVNTRQDAMAASVLSSQADAGQAGIRWEVVPPHDRALFPYEEQWEVVILKLAL